MDKREKVRQAIERVWRDYNTPETFVKAIFDVLDEPDEPATPKRNWPAVDENTPAGTLCWTSQDHSRAEPLREYRKDDPTGCKYSYKTFNISRYSERFIGIHLLDNPGLEELPCDGLVLITENDKRWNQPEIFLGDSCEVLWSRVISWAPVKWDNGRLVVDLDRLR